MASGRVGARSDVGRVREDNEDRYLVRAKKGTLLLAVADGVGGEAGGEVASTAAVRSLGSSFVFGADNAAGALTGAMRAANDAVLKAATDSGYLHAASTLVAAAIREGQVAVGNLGDSRAYLVRNGSARQITADHSGALPGSITRFVGDPRGAAPDVFVEPLRPDDHLVLCSDGLTLHVREDEIAATADQATGPQSAAEQLVALAKERGGEDNVTVVVFAAGRRRGASAGLLRTVAVVLALAAVAAVTLATPR